MDFSVKKIVLAAVVCSSFAGASSVMADTGNPTVPVGKKVSALTMHVIGNITKSTCDIRPYTTAGADATTLNMGTMTTGKESTPVSFFLKPANGCSEGITGGGSTAAEITWESNGLTEHGISNMYGTAKNVHIELSPVGGDGVAVTDATGFIKTGAQTVVYSTIATTGKSPDTPLPFKYNVKLVSDNGGGMDAGTVDTDMSYTVAYK
ncbi:hypothetical protein R2E04_002433 [Salmonella enterica]|nr:hypothetical protein [Salmonella enterica subsp. enterica serovar Pensacola]EEB7432300.1 hypothetical protein [Salmonella enterica]EDR6290228.1 hypothetical protein [Salmonella enterica subsp. enterica serovar Pensacola]EEO0308810.1 hypothetical protein [Salmonella enterica]EGM1536540.1 hypothetical protein [Salmonella enterica]